MVAYTDCQLLILTDDNRFSLLLLWDPSRKMEPSLTSRKKPCLRKRAHLMVTVPLSTRLRSVSLSLSAMGLSVLSPPRLSVSSFDGLRLSIVSHFQREARKTSDMKIVLGSVAVTIALLVLTDNKHSASDTFGQVSDGSGWGSQGFSYLIGYLSVAWTMTDYDATVRVDTCMCWLSHADQDLSGPY